MDITLIKNLKRLQDELFNYIIFMANPRMNYVLQKELRIEATHIMCEQHYNWWYPKLARHWHLNDVETMYEIPSAPTAKEVVIDKAVVEGVKQPVILHESNNKKTNIG